ncbi:MAG: hypothetical protein WCS43_02405 [Verrucomicrobiota bacterium]
MVWMTGYGGVDVDDIFGGVGWLERRAEHFQWVGLRSAAGVFAFGVASFVVSSAHAIAFYRCFDPDGPGFLPVAFRHGQGRRQVYDIVPHGNG